jgi:hypothetical protein
MPALRGLVIFVCFRAKKMLFVRLTMTRQTVGKSWKQGDQIGRFFSVLGSFLLLAVILKMTQVA